MTERQMEKEWPNILGAGLLYLGVFVAIIFSGIFLGTRLNLEDTAQTLWANGILEILIIGVPAAIMALYYQDNMKQVLRLNKVSASNFWLTVGLAITGYIITVFISLVWYSLLSKLGEPMPQDIPSVTTNREYLVAIICICLIPAVCEELMFRGMLFSGFRRLGAVRAIILTGILFGVYHVTLMTIPSIILLGIAITWVVYQTDSLFCGVIFHFIYNFISTTLTYAQGALMQFATPTDVDLIEGGIDAMPKEMLMAAYGIWGIFAIGSVVVFFFFAYLMRKKNGYKRAKDCKPIPMPHRVPIVVELIPIFITFGIIIRLWGAELMTMMMG
jgi:membrane protease YdiL (CAAX protease family)